MLRHNGTLLESEFEIMLKFSYACHQLIDQICELTSE